MATTREEESDNAKLQFYVSSEEVQEQLGKNLCFVRPAGVPITTP